MKKDSVLILIKEYCYFFKYIKYSNLEKAYKDSKINDFFKKIVFKFRIPIYPIFFNKWKKTLYEYNSIIIFDSAYSPLMTKYIKKKNKKCKVKLYFWNNITFNRVKALKDRNIDEFWTFDPRDAQNYKMLYNPQFYTKNIKSKDTDCVYDALFLGRPKERKKELIDIKDCLEDNGLNTKMIIIENEKDYISYDEYIKLLGKSRSIIDIINKNQTGLTLRCMEALFLKKKLITNNIEIKKCEFYNPNNIFIIGEDDIKDVKEFLNNKYIEINQEIINKYDFDNWKDNFEKINN